MEGRGRKKHSPLLFSVYEDLRLTSERREGGREGALSVPSIRLRTRFLSHGLNERGGGRVKRSFLPDDDGLLNALRMGNETRGDEKKIINKAIGNFFHSYHSFAR